MWSRWAISAPTRPRLSHTPRRMASISAGDFSGNAALRLARPVRCSGSHGPAARMTAPAKLLTDTRSRRWTAASSSAAIRPAAALPADLMRRRINQRRCFQLVPMAPVQQPWLISRVILSEKSATFRDHALEIHDHLAEHLAGFEALEAALEVGERDLGINHRGEAVRHLGERGRDVTHRGAERAENPVLLLEQLHEVEGGRRPRSGAAGDEPAAALERQERAREGFRADMLEHHVDTLLGGDPAHHVLEAVLAVVDDVVGADRLRFRGLGVVP